MLLYILIDILLKTCGSYQTSKFNICMLHLYLSLKFLKSPKSLRSLKIHKSPKCLKCFKGPKSLKSLKTQQISS